MTGAGQEGTAPTDGRYEDVSSQGRRRPEGGNPAKAQILAYRRRIVRREVDEAVRRLERSGELSARDHAILEALARTLAAGILPMERVAEVVDDAKPATKRAVASLFPAE